MKLQCESDTIRLRLNEAEYQRLLKEKNLSEHIPYLPLGITIYIENSDRPTVLKNSSLIIFLTNNSLEELGNPKQIKSGIILWLETPHGEFTLNLQVDLNSKTTKQTQSN